MSDPHSMTEAMIRNAYEEGVEDGISWHCYPESGPQPQWIDSVARVEFLQSARPIDRLSEGVPASPSGCQPTASAAEEASSQSGIPNAWQPIQTARRDGKPLLCFSLIHGHNVTRVLYWDDDDGGMWVCPSSGSSYAPTHWMPLPEPPASVDTLPKGQDAQQGLAGTEGSAVGAAETPIPGPIAPVQDDE